MIRQSARYNEEIVTGSNSAIDKSRQALFDLSRDIHSHPELNYQEYYSSNALAGFLESRGIQVERGIGGLETAFSATIPAGPVKAQRLPYSRNMTRCQRSGTAVDTTSLQWRRWALPSDYRRPPRTCPDAR